MACCGFSGGSRVEFTMNRGSDAAKFFHLGIGLHLAHVFPLLHEFGCTSFAKVGLVGLSMSGGRFSVSGDNGAVNGGSLSDKGTCATSSLPQSRSRSPSFHPPFPMARSHWRGSARCWSRISHFRW